MTDIKTVQALVEALGRSQLPEDSGLWDSHLAAIAAGNALIAQMQREAVQPVAVRYKNANGRWRYLNYPFTKGWAFPMSLGTPEPLYAAPQPAQASDRVEQIQPVHPTRASGVRASTTRYTWPPKACPCGSNQRTACQELGCEWERDPSLVPSSLRSAAGAQQQDDHAGSPAHGARLVTEQSPTNKAFWEGVQWAQAGAESSKAALSDEEIDAVFRANHNSQDEPWVNWRRFARAILARAGITPQAGKESGE